jgi:hypothetical protein
MLRPCCRCASIMRWRMWPYGTRNGDRFAPVPIWCVHRVTGLSSRDGLMKPQQLRNSAVLAGRV